LTVPANLSITLTVASSINCCAAPWLADFDHQENVDRSVLDGMRLVIEARKAARR